MAQDVWVDLFAEQRWASLCGGRGVGADPQRDGIAAEPPSGAGREERIAGVSGSFAEPEPQERLDGAGERDGSLFSSFAFAVDAGAGSECDVAAVQAGEFGDPKAGDAQMETAARSAWRQVIEVTVVDRVSG
jgi:hypothetical protein